MTRTAILLSGGMDSIALAYWKHPDVAYTIDYGQASALGEFRAAGAVCRVLGIPQREIRVDCRSLGSGDLAGTEPNPQSPSSEWWPFRNQLLITLGAMQAMQDQVTVLLVGTVATDSFHRDGTKEFFDAADGILRMQEGGLSVQAPAIHLTTAELVKASGVDAPMLAWAHSCHTSNLACGCCRGCCKHRSVMTELGHGSY